MIAALMLIAGAVFFTGIQWGLPSRRVDRYLFGDQPVWSGKKIMQLAGEHRDDASLAANVPQHVLQHRDQILQINQTDADRAEIIRRYRLYSAQPDENTLLMALARMKPGRGDFDPKFYQYGGLFVYPVGALLKVAEKMHYIPLTSDVAYYIDHPELFGRFYVVARALPALWGIAGVWAVFEITRRLTGGAMIPAIAALIYIFMPVVINMAHEAKPHLPGAVLLLYTVLAATDYVRIGSRKSAIVTGVLCGAAVGTVLWAVMGLVILPVMIGLRSRRVTRSRVRVLFLALLTAIATYFITNPYVAINLVRNRALLHSNLTNTTDMYQSKGLALAIPNAFRLISEGASLGVALLGAVTFLVAIQRWRARGWLDAREGGRVTLVILLFAPCLLIGLQYVLFASGKPAEYGRFALFPDIALGVCAVAGASRFIRLTIARILVLTAMLVTIGVSGGSYLHAFVLDASPLNTRWTAAEAVKELGDKFSGPIGIWAEPAPYSVPPVNLFKNQLLLLPPGYIPPPANPSPVSLLIRTEDSPAAVPEPWAANWERWVIQQGRATQISWANKPLVIYAAPVQAHRENP